MKNLLHPMNSPMLWLLCIALVFTACEDTSTSNNNTFTNPTTNGGNVETPTEPKDPPPADTRKPLYLQGVYATSNHAAINNVFDGNASSVWKTKKGAGPDEGIMLYFQKPISIGKIEIEEATGGDLAKVDEYILYGNGAPIGNGRMGEPFDMDHDVSALYIRFGSTNQDVEVNVNEETKKGAVLKFSENHSIGIQEIKIWDLNKKEYRLVPPRKVKAKISASSTLSPELAYGTSKLFDTRKEFAWVEGADGYGEGEQLNFQLEEDVKIDEVLVWNGYQRSPSHFKSNTRLKGFSLGESGGKMYEYTLRDDDAAQKIDLKVGLDSRNFEMKFNSVYKGRSYKDLAVSELLFFEDGKPLQLEVVDDAAEKAIVQKTKGTILEGLLDARIANELEYTVSGFFAERSIILRSDGTFVIYLMENEDALDETGGAVFVSIADGNWEILSANSNEAKIKIFGKLLDASAIEAYYAGMNDQAEFTRIFKDNLVIKNNLITGEKILDEIVIR